MCAVVVVSRKLRMHLITLSNYKSIPNLIQSKIKEIYSSKILIRINEIICLLVTCFINVLLREYPSKSHRNYYIFNS